MSCITVGTPFFLSGMPLLKRKQQVRDAKKNLYIYRVIPNPKIKDTFAPETFPEVSENVISFFYLSWLKQQNKSLKTGLIMVLTV